MSTPKSMYTLHTAHLHIHVICVQNTPILTKNLGTKPFNFRCSNRGKHGTVIF